MLQGRWAWKIKARLIWLRIMCLQAAPAAIFWNWFLMAIRPEPKPCVRGLSSFVYVTCLSCIGWQQTLQGHLCQPNKACRGLHWPILPDLKQAQAACDSPAMLHCIPETSCVTSRNARPCGVPHLEAA